MLSVREMQVMQLRKSGQGCGSEKSSGGQSRSQDVAAVALLGLKKKLPTGRMMVERAPVMMNLKIYMAQRWDFWWCMCRFKLLRAQYVCDTFVLAITDISLVTYETRGGIKSLNIKPQGVLGSLENDERKARCQSKLMEQSYCHPLSPRAWIIKYEEKWRAPYLSIIYWNSPKWFHDVEADIHIWGYNIVSLRFECPANPPCWRVIWELACVKV